MFQNIPGKRIKLYTGSSSDQNSYIYDDSVPGDAISTNGRHEGVSLTIQGIEIVFDNHHQEGINRKQWMTNLVFYRRLHQEQEFQIKEEEF